MRHDPVVQQQKVTIKAHQHFEGTIETFRIASKLQEHLENSDEFTASRLYIYYKTRTSEF